MSESSAGSREGMLRSARFALHAITALLVVVTVVRATTIGAPLVLTMLLGGLFLAVYGTGAVFARSSRTAIGWLLALTAVWLGMLVVSAEYVWMVFPLLLLAGHLLPLLWALLLAAALLAAAIIAPVLHGTTLTAAHVIGPVVGGGFALAISLGYDALLRDAQERERLIGSLVAAQQETAALQGELLRTQRAAGATQERTRLSQELHDTIAQELSSMVMLARSGEVERMPQIQERAQHALVDLRRIVAALAPKELEGSELARALERMTEQFAGDTGIATECTITPVSVEIPTPTEVVLLRVAQSALANVRQHAAASRVKVSLGEHAAAITLRVSDDGQGFDTEAGPSSPSSYGLVAMRARLREVGGELALASAPGGGTVLSASIPLMREGMA